MKKWSRSCNEAAQLLRTISDSVPMLSFNALHEKLDNELEQHPEQTFILKAVLLALAIILIKKLFGSFFYPVIAFSILNYVVYLWKNTNKSIREILNDQVSFFSAPKIASLEKTPVTAWATWGVIGANCFIFLFFESEYTYPFIRNNLIFLPRDPTFWNVPLSLFSAMYLHSGFSHLFSNMLYLWSMGTVVEHRIGWKRFLVIYHLAGIAGSFTDVIISGAFTGETVHSLGASGAISGIMGVFLVRCYFKKMVVPIPTFGLPVSFNIRLNSLTVLAIYFMTDLQGGLRSISGSLTSNVSYWDHFGSAMAGIWMAYRLKLADEAIEERHREIGTGIFDGKTIKTKAFEDAEGFNGARKSLLIALEKSPDNPETLLALARIESHFEQTERGRECFRKAVEILAQQPSPHLTVAFSEYFTRYREIMAPELQLKISGLLYREGNLDYAERTLKMLADRSEAPADIREQALLLSGRILEKMELHEAAEYNYRQFLELYPDSIRMETVHERLRTVSGSAI